MGEEVPTNVAPTRSSRDHGQLRARLTSWLADRLPAGSAPEIVSLASTDSNGMSSETLLVDADWGVDGERREHRMVARLAPSADDVPVFPTYALGHQAEVMRVVGEREGAPVPKVWWHEPDESVIGAEFFMMERVDGDVPPDVMPYNFGDSWLFHASAADQRRLQDATVAVLAEIHAVEDPASAFPFLAPHDGGTNSLARHVAKTRHWYEWMVTGSERCPALDSAFDVVAARMPSDDAEHSVLCWGDSRIGNMMYRDFAPVAVFDWEMTAIGPRELDVAWLAYAHRMFESLCAFFGLPGMPDFLRRDDVVDTYRSVTGHECRHMRWYTAYAALQFGIVFLRIGQRAIHFGEAERPVDVDELIRNKDDLERTLDELEE